MLPETIARRSFLRAGGLSLGSMALGQLLARDGRAAAAVPKLPFAPKAKRVIWLYMAGGMSH
ncbi:MAG: sulfatase, partial [Planctomycetota bacterium]